MAYPFLDLCTCPVDTRLQALIKINTNLVTLFSTMAIDFIGTRVTMIGDGCGCTEQQVLAAINENIVEFSGVFTGGGRPDTVEEISNNSGNSTITPDSSQHIEIVTLGGSARTSVFILDTTDRVIGDRLTLRFITPATANIVIEVRNATSGGTLIYSYTTDGGGTDYQSMEVYFNGTAWKALTNASNIV